MAIRALSLRSLAPTLGLLLAACGARTGIEPGERGAVAAPGGTPGADPGVQVERCGVAIAPPAPPARPQGYACDFDAASDELSMVALRYRAIQGLLRSGETRELFRFDVAPPYDFISPIAPSVVPRGRFVGVAQVFPAKQGEGHLLWFVLLRDGLPIVSKKIEIEVSKASNSIAQRS